VTQILAVASLALFVALVLAFAYVLRRTAGVVAVTREEDAFRRDGAALAERAATVIGEGAPGIDRVRRRTEAATSLDEPLPQLLEALAGLRAEAEALAPPPALALLRDRLAHELERATRAVETVQHGCVLLGATAGRPRETEGETSIKRGYLNLLHAREALVTLGVDLRSGRVDARRWFSDRSRAEGPPPPAA
jgi:hypothetical protein